MPKFDSSPGDAATTVAALISEQTSPEIIRHNAVENSSSDVTDIPFPLNKLELPDFITPLPKSVDRDVLRLLLRKGALAVPQKATIDELLRGFIRYVYPLLPVLDMGSFLNAMGGTGGKTVSLLLFQAVLMTGVTFADWSHLRADFQSCKEAQKIFFERVKLLYEMDVESNPTTMIQVLLLMTCWDGQPDETKGRFYWLGIALSLATGIGLDNDHHYSDQPDQQRLRRRLWGCCITRSHLLSLVERRQFPFQCAARDFEPLRPEEFDDVALSRVLGEFGGMPGHGVETKVMGQIFLQTIKLCVIIRHILQTQYESRDLRRLGSNDALMVLVPRTKIFSIEVIARDQELREWYEETSSIKDTAFGQDHRSNGNVLGVHSATLELLYLTVLSTVHRPYLLYEKSTDSAIGALQAFSRLSLLSAAKRITEIGRNLADGNLVQFLPSSAVGTFIAASLQHLDDAVSTDSELRSTGSLYLSQTLDAFAAWRGKYNSVDSAIGFIERVKSGEISYSSLEREGPGYFMSRWDHDLASYTTGDEDACSNADTNTLLQLDMQSGGIRLTGESRGAMPRSLDDGNESVNMPYALVPNLEGYSEMLISSMDRSQVDSAMV